MPYIQNTNWRFKLVSIIAVLLGLMFLINTQMAVAAERESRQRDSGQREFMDSRYNHNHSYPVRGRFVTKLPRDYRTVVYGNAKFYFSGGVWYRPEGRRFVVMAPPIGLFIPFLPLVYTTIWVGGVPLLLCQ